MPDSTDLKRKLRYAALAANAQPTERQLDEAVQELEKKAHVTKSDLFEVGRKVASNSEIFASTDIEDINNILDQIRNKRK